jgi:DNA polymerase-1
MAETAGVPVEQMEPVVQAFDNQYPRMKAYANELTRLVEQRYRTEGEGYIITPTTGRRLPVEFKKEYRGTNYTIQGSAADIMKQAIVRMEAAGLSENLRIPVHDEIIVDAPRENWEEIAETVNECMTVREGWAIPLTAEGSGPLNRWGDKYADEGGH